MKYLIVLVSIPLLISCASVAPYSPSETCALQNMKLEGMSTGSSETSGSGAAFGSGSGNMAFGTSSSSSNINMVHCSVPKIPEDQCRVSGLRSSVRPKYEYNDGIGTKRFLTGVGYVAFIAPGLALKLLFDSQESKAEEESRSIASVIPYKCNGHATTKEEAAQDLALDKEVKAYQAAHTDVDWKSKDALGETLELKILKSASKNHLTFTQAADKMLAP